MVLCQKYKVDPHNFEGFKQIPDVYLQSDFYEDFKRLELEFQKFKLKILETMENLRLQMASYSHYSRDTADKHLVHNILKLQTLIKGEQPNIDESKL